ncbi:MAG: hypothetical protein WD096_09915 [Actinomycetota bacterium]
MKIIGPDDARRLLRLLELPDDDRYALIFRLFKDEDGTALAEVLADVEEDLTGRTRARLIDGLRAVLVERA